LLQHRKWPGFATIGHFLENFLMPGRVREFNAIHAAKTATMLGVVQMILPKPAPLLELAG
jgi:hypothetical protein